ncbi:MAG: tetratricopeptide repeat protein [Rhodothermales bacterium]|nr:tetratricopeptide repeat protein [Rhodothermales bacterium]
MLRKIDTPRYEAYLAAYRMPPISFTDRATLPSSLRPIWTALQAEAPDAAIRNAETALSASRLFSAEEKAGLLFGLAAAQLAAGATEDAWENARRSLDLFPHQIGGKSLQAAIQASRRNYEIAYDQLKALEPVSSPAIWDIAIDPVEHALALASFSWLCGQWDQVAEHIEEAYPKGLTSMPDEIQEDWFRLAHYRGQAEEAAKAAAILITRRPVELADEMLQTIVQNGWYSEALPLYRDAFGRAPNSELLRRRLVALYIKEGDLEEARRLTAPGALRTAA